MNEVKFYFCPVCGNIIEKVHDSGNDLECCGRTMLELEPGDSDGNIEYHVPTCRKYENTIEVTVGKSSHPMEKDHYIKWIEISTNKGIYRKYLEPADEPIACFEIDYDEVVTSIFSYCNKHKLFRAFC